MSSLRRGHANLLCIVPIFTDDSEEFRVPRGGPPTYRGAGMHNCVIVRILNEDKHHKTIITVVVFREHSFLCFLLRQRGGRRLVVELARLLVEGGSLLDGAEAGDAEGLTGLGDGLGPAADVLERALAGGVGLAGHDLAVLVLHEKGLLVAGLGLLAGAVPDLALASTDTDATGHLEVVSWFGGADKG